MDTLRRFWLGGTLDNVVHSAIVRPEMTYVQTVVR
jgi:hypothetical protein